MTKRTILIGATLAALCAGTARAADVPVNTGLWEMQMTMSMGGIQISPEMQDKLKKMGVNPPGMPTSSTRQMCVTEQTLARFGAPDQGGKCHQENVQRSAKGMSFDLVCENPQTNAHGHVDVLFDDRTHVHGAVRMSGTHTMGGGQSVPFSVDATQTGHWLSNDCGAVKPLG